MKKIITYNVNGIRAAMKKGLIEWLESANVDILCIQETKARPEQVNTEAIEQLGYRHYWVSAEKKGYSGVSIWTKEEPQHIEYGCGIEKYDFEGRVIRCDFKDYSVMSVYMPSGSSGDLRQAFKMEWLEDFKTYIDELKKKIPNLIITGDYNICHTEIDIHNPKTNKDTSGFKPEEREWVSEFIASGFVDSFRAINKDPHHYSWWSYRANARAKNLGWRIDYNMVSEPIKHLIQHAEILADVKHSDHCPVSLSMKA